MTLQLPTVSDPALQAIFDLIAQAVPDLRGLLYIGIGNPNGTITASPPALYLNRAGGAGATLYVKESGIATSAGWIGK